MKRESSRLSENYTYIIAEMACSHEGDPDLAVKIIDGAGKAGADAIQFQIWSLKDMVIPQHNDHDILSSIELSRDQWQQLRDYSKETYPEMDIIACVYESESVDFSMSLGVDAFKIHSADLSNPDFIKRSKSAQALGCRPAGISSEKSSSTNSAIVATPFRI